jgi:hypothetical protein
MEDLTVSTSTVSTTTIPIQISEVITQVKAEDLPSADIKFITEGLSVAEIKRVIGLYYRDLGCLVRVYYTRTRARFLVIVKMRHSLITTSGVVSMFAENSSDAVILPIGKILSKEEASDTSEGFELFKALTSQDVDREIGKVVFLRKSELRTAS